MCGSFLNRTPSFWHNCAVGSISTAVGFCTHIISRTLKIFKFFLLFHQNNGVDHINEDDPTLRWGKTQGIIMRARNVIPNNESFYKNHYWSESRWQIYRRILTSRKRFLRAGCLPLSIMIFRTAGSSCFRRRAIAGITTGRLSSDERNPKNLTSGSFVPCRRVYDLMITPCPFGNHNGATGRSYVDIPEFD